VERRSGGFSYIQGSGDDHELWGKVYTVPFPVLLPTNILKGLTPKLFWQHREELLRASQIELPAVVSALVASQVAPNRSVAPTPISRIGDLILLCSISDLFGTGFSPSCHASSHTGESIAYLLITGKISEYSQPKESIASRILQIESPGGKRGQIHYLQIVLSQSVDFINSHLSKGTEICIACDTGEDLSIGVALAALQVLFDENGNFVGNREQGRACVYCLNPFTIARFMLMHCSRQDIHSKAPRVDHSQSAAGQPIENNVEAC
jgi:tRNA A64-2'-O-ribosylphosphate transferase